MKIVIAGAGKVGFELARALSQDHDVTVIDKNAQALERLGELIDIYPVTGDIKNPATYRRLLDQQVDVFIAVTDSDEANILSVLIASDTIAIDRRIIRLRDDVFAQSRFLNQTGALEPVFPYRLSAETVRWLLRYPEANNVKHFAHTRHALISIKVDNPLHEAKTVEEFENDRLKIVGLERDKRFMLPTKETAIHHGDLLYFLGDGAVLESLYGQLDLQMPPHIEHAVVFGGNALGIEVAKVLIDEGVRVKIVEKDIEQCHRLSDIFQDKALVINSHYDEAILYEEEHLDRANMVITTDRKDEINIVRALQAKEHGIPKVIAINNEHKYYPLMHQLGMVVARGPQTSVFYAILESIARDATLQIRHFCGGEGVVLAHTILEKSTLIGRPIRAWKREGSLWVVRDDHIGAVSAESRLDVGDMLLLVTQAAYENEGIAWMRTL